MHGRLSALLIVLGGCAQGGAPRIEIVADQVAVVGKELSVWIVGTDPDGDELTYAFEAPAVPLAGNTARMGTGANGQGLFTFTPLAQQIGEQLFDFVVSDGSFEARTSARIDVRSAAGSDSAPIFREPLASGAVLDLGVDTCATVDVLVEDADSSRIELRMDEPIVEGAELFVGDSGLEGTWSWCPTPEQRASQAHHEVVFVADDGDSSAVRKSFLVVVRPADPGECPGEVPVVTHTPQDAATLSDIEIAARVTDDTGVSGTPFVLYSTEDPGTPPDYGAMSLAAFELQIGGATDGEWLARVPNPVAADDEGSATTLYYAISVVDVDGCGVDDPNGAVHTIEVTHPGGEGAGLCEMCSYDSQCGGPGDHCLAQEGEGRCATACASDAECDDGFVCSAAALTSIEGATGRQCIPAQGLCGADSCIDDGFEPNDGVGAALAKPRLPQGTHADLQLCAGNDDWYAFVLGYRAKVRVDLDGPALPDLDLVLASDGGVVFDASEGAQSTESVLTGCLDPADYLVHVYSIFADFEAPADYALSLTLEPC
jgi:hypothetical protein